MWRGESGWRRDVSPRLGGLAPAQLPAYVPVPTLMLPLGPTGDFTSDVPAPEQMTFGELRGHIERLQSSGANAVPATVSLHRKVAFPVVTLIMTLLAVPFAVSTGRRGALYGVGVGIVFAISYWLMMTVFFALGTGGVLPPMLAAWAPNILFGAAALYMILTVRT
jgi:lipopolysaccharide export LptBFGC system permease protein LptF